MQPQDPDNADPYIRPHFERSALIVIDTQVDFVDGGSAAIPGTTEVLERLEALVGAFRSARRPIVHAIRLYDGADVDLVRRTALVAGNADVVRPGSDGSQIVPRLLPDDAVPLNAQALLTGTMQDVGPDEVIVWKPRWSAFFRTSLHGYLTERGIDTLVFAGCNFPNCPRASIFDASERDYRIVVATDAVSQLTPERLADAASIGASALDTDTISARLDSRTADGQ